MAMPNRLARAACGIALTLVAGLSAAQPYPSQAVRIIVPFPPGGGVDVLTRAVAGELTVRWKQPVIVENRAGAGSVVGANAVAQAAADGYTLMATVNQTITSNPFLHKSLPYDPQKSFAPVSLMVQTDMFVLANPAVAARDLKELVDLVRREPAKHNFGSFGVGSQPQLLFETLNKRNGLDLLHVPFNGVAPLLTAIVAGDVELTTGSHAVAGALLRAGKLKALAVAGKKRARGFPEVPTAAEQGHPYLNATIWYALFAPSATRPDILNRISADVRAILAVPEFAERHVTSKGLDTIASTPEELRAVIQEETAVVAEMVKSAGIKPE
ncbi:MAG: tripartite tricarboxylate transporter substrate binding protein [Betaproteobacteria bacterium]|nr:tripartite tricarboxylate transporter substrate binding protein [Betaproteobacteria bacterium]